MEYGLIGEKLGHSFSKEVHNLIGDYNFILKEIPKDNLKQFIADREFKGINVTIPYKQEVIPLLDFIEPMALEIGAVNCIVNRNGKLSGYNTDWLGFQCLINRLGVRIEGKVVAVLGTGGTSKTIKSVLAKNKVKQIVSVSRNAKDGCIDYQQLYEMQSQIDIIVNATPVGMYPNIKNAPVDIEQFSNLVGVIDVIYNPLDTALIQKARALNIPCQNGLYMLVAQAVYAYGYFFDRDIDKQTSDQIFNKLLLQKQNIVLIGMPSCGKTTIGKLIAQKLGREFIDTDQLIIENSKMQIAEIFSKFGEDYFRDLESSAIEQASLKSGVVIATGGGAVLKEKNVNLLKQNGKVFFIDRGIENLLSTNDRPLSSSREKLEKLFNCRYAIYQKLADAVVNGNESLQEVVNNILGEK